MTELAIQNMENYQVNAYYAEHKIIRFPDVGDMIIGTSDQVPISAMNSFSKDDILDLFRDSYSNAN